MIAIFGGGEIAEKGIRRIFRDNCVLVSPEKCDVREPAAVHSWIAKHLPETTVFTAGISRPGPLTEPGESWFHANSGWVEEELPGWSQEILVNLGGAFNVAAAAIAHGVENLIFVASLAGLYGKPNHAGYSASKAGVISLVQSLAMEGHNAYAISPGRVNTAMRERDYPGEDPKTRLDPLVIGGLVKDILEGKYTPGDNLVIRKRGHEVLPVEIHRGDGWRERLKVGEPPTC